MLKDILEQFQNGWASEEGRSTTDYNLLVKIIIMIGDGTWLQIRKDITNLYIVVIANTNMMLTPR